MPPHNTSEDPYDTVVPKEQPVDMRSVVGESNGSSNTPYIEADENPANRELHEGNQPAPKEGLTASGSAWALAPNEQRGFLTLCKKDGTSNVGLSPECIQALKPGGWVGIETDARKGGFYLSADNSVSLSLERDGQNVPLDSGKVNKETRALATKINEGDIVSIPIGEDNGSGVQKREPYILFFTRGPQNSLVPSMVSLYAEGRDGRTMLEILNKAGGDYKQKAEMAKTFARTSSLLPVYDENGQRVRGSVVKAPARSTTNREPSREKPKSNELRWSNLSDFSKKVFGEDPLPSGQEEFYTGSKAYVGLNELGNSAVTVGTRVDTDEPFNYKVLGTNTAAVSGQHFSIYENSAGTMLLKDGPPPWKNGKESTNGVFLEGKRLGGKYISGGATELTGYDLIFTGGSEQCYFLYVEADIDGVSEKRLIRLPNLDGNNAKEMTTAFINMRKNLSTEQIEDLKSEAIAASNAIQQSLNFS
jgi:pSer/pThr/pTyr-binding forkhead associated (FHA) protein